MHAFARSLIVAAIWYVVPSGAGSLRAQEPAPAALSTDRRATIPVLVVVSSGREGEPSTGGVMSVDVRVTDNVRRIPVVSCSVARPGVRNDTWQASAWMAAFAAARETNHKMLEYEYYVNAPDVIDGPSAGMVLSATMLALIKRTPVLPGRALTGTVNPDGTVGPVGGIPHKLVAAKKAGVTRFGYPAGQRLEYSAEEQRYVDIGLRCQQLGMESVELRDINDAYLLLTDQKTGREITSVPTATPVLPQGAADKIRAAYIRAHGQYQAKFQETVELFNGSMPHPKCRSQDLHDSLSNAQEFDDNGGLSYRAGSVSAAYIHQLNALAMCESVENELRTMKKGSGSKVPVKDKLNGAVEVLMQIRDAVQQGREALEITVQGNLTAQSLVPRIEALSAYINLREGLAHELAGDRLVSTAIQQAQKVSTKNGAMPDGFLECVAKACLYYAQAKTRYQTSQDYYSSLSPRPAGEDVVLHLTPEFEQSIGNAFTQGAQATLVFLETTTGPQWRNEVKAQLAGKKMADGFQTNFEDRPEAVSLVDPSYLPNQMAATFDQRRPDSERSAIEGIAGRKWKFQTETTGNLDSFGSGASSYLGLSAMVLQYYNYGRPENMTYSRSFGLFIDLARSKAMDASRRVEEAMIKEIGNAPAVGASSLLPSAILVNLELADSLRYGSNNDKVLSLKVYWRVSMLCDLAIDMMRQSKG